MATRLVSGHVKVLETPHQSSLEEVRNLLKSTILADKHTMMMTPCLGSVVVGMAKMKKPTTYPCPLPRMEMELEVPLILRAPVVHDYIPGLKYFKKRQIFSISDISVSMYLIVSDGSIKSRKIQQLIAFNE